MSSITSGQSSDRRAIAATRADIAELHNFEHMPSLRLWPLILLTLALSGAASALPAAYWPLLIVIWLVQGAASFSLVLAFHDASHDRLNPIHSLNEMFGHIVGTIIFVPLEVYRHAHARHHAFLGTEADPELWPFNSPRVARPLRVMAAFFEIVFGVFYTPFLFLRSVLVDELSRRERRLIIAGYLMCFVAWVAIITVVYDFGLWHLLLITTIIPMAIAGSLQTVNKYTQHLGLHGESVLGLTRTVVDETQAAELVSSAMFYNDYHGTHHRYAKIPYYNLPDATPFTLAGAQEPCPVYPNLASAFVDMLPCLANPKVGPQWLKKSA